MSQTMRRLVHVLLCLSLVAGVGCASAKKPRSRGLARIVETGELRVGMSGEQPPLNMTARTGELFGMEVALIRVLARSMGVRAVLVQRPFGELLDALEAGDVDLVMSGMTITPERSTRATFVGPYYTSGKAILTRSPELAAAESPHQIDSSKLRFAALAGSTSETFARESLPSAKLVTTSTLDEAIQKLLRGDVDALVADRETGSFAVLRYPEQGLIASKATFTIEPMGIAIPPDQPQLANLIQTYMNALMESGALEKSKSFWFKDPSWVKNMH